MKYWLLITLLIISILVFLAGKAMRIMLWPFGIEVYYLGLSSAILMVVLIIRKAVRGKKHG